MEPRPRDSAQKESVVAPKDRRRPLAEVIFRQPVEVPGVDVSVRRLEPGKKIHLSEVIAPQAFFDPELRCIMIGDCLYPMDGGLVARMRFAKAAKTIK